MLRASVARARQSALKKAASGINRSIIQKYDDGCGGARTATIRAPDRDGPTLASCDAIWTPVSPMLTRLSRAVVMLASITVRNLPSTISVRDAGLRSRVSIVPRSFSPAQRSIDG